MSLSVNYLEKIQESDKLPSGIKTTLNIFLAAINDWPNPVMDLVDYEKEIYKLLGEDVNRKKMEEYISRIDYSKDAWEGESLSQLIEIYNCYEGGKPLKEIFKEIKDKIEEQR